MGRWRLVVIAFRLVRFRRFLLILGCSCFRVMWVGWMCRFVVLIVGRRVGWFPRRLICFVVIVVVVRGCSLRLFVIVILI